MMSTLVIHTTDVRISSEKSHSVHLDRWDCSGHTLLTPPEHLQKHLEGRSKLGKIKLGRKEKYWSELEDNRPRQGYSISISRPTAGTWEDQEKWKLFPVEGWLWALDFLEPPRPESFAPLTPWVMAPLQAQGICCVEEEGGGLGGQCSAKEVGVMAIPSTCSCPRPVLSR